MTKPGRYSRADLIRSENLPKKPGKVVKLPKKLDNPDEKEQWLRQLHNASIPKIIDLFCGAGGMSEGFIQAGFTVAVACDHDAEACNTFAANIPAKVVCTDISAIADPRTLLEDLPITSIDVIVGGPPCQGFSVVGRARIKSLKEDKQRILLARNELYQQFFRFVEAFLPPFFLMENVPTLINFDNGAYMEGIRQECERLQYDLIDNVIDVADYGIPQTRRRLFIVGSRKGRLFRWPRRTHENSPVSLQDAISDLPKVLPPSEEECLPYVSDGQTSQYQQQMRCSVKPMDKGYIYDHIVRPVREDDIHIFMDMKPGDRYVDIDPRYQRYNSQSFKDKYYKLIPDLPCVTITAHLSKDGYRYIHWDNDQHRTLSVREAARIQSFSDHFRFSGSRTSRFRQIGNAVPPLMAEELARQIHMALRRSTGDISGETVQLGLYQYLSQLVVSSE